MAQKFRLLPCFPPSQWEIDRFDFYPDLAWMGEPFLGIPVVEVIGRTLLPNGTPSHQTVFLPDKSNPAAEWNIQGDYLSFNDFDEDDLPRLSPVIPFTAEELSYMNGFQNNGLNFVSARLWQNRLFLHFDDQDFSAPEANAFPRAYTLTLPAGFNVIGNRGETCKGGTVSTV